MSLAFAAAVAAHGCAAAAVPSAGWRLSPISGCTCTPCMRQARAALCPCLPRAAVGLLALLKTPTRASHPPCPSLPRADLASRCAAQSCEPLMRPAPPGFTRGAQAHARVTPRRLVRVPACDVIALLHGTACLLIRVFQAPKPRAQRRVVRQHGYWWYRAARQGVGEWGPAPGGRKRRPGRTRSGRSGRAGCAGSPGEADTASARPGLARGRARARAAPWRPPALRQAGALAVSYTGRSLAPWGAAARQRQSMWAPCPVGGARPPACFRKTLRATRCGQRRGRGRGRPDRRAGLPQPVRRRGWRLRAASPT
jgi:hypothetical protein